MRVEKHPTRGYLEVDIRTRGPDGSPIRKRIRSPVQSKSGAQRWGEALQSRLAFEGKEKPTMEVPTLAEFAPRFREEYAVANGNKPSSLDAKDRIIRLHLLPVIGSLRLNEIEDAAGQKVKAQLAKQKASPKTVACVLSVLTTMLRAAEQWKLIARAPKLRSPRVPPAEMGFYDFEEFERLVAGAAKVGASHLAFVLLAGEAGLRRGELVAYEQSDTTSTEVVVKRSEWQGEVGLPKGGKHRRVPMTARLRAALSDLAHLRGKRLLWQANGEPVGVPTLQSWLEVACKRAGLPESRDIHKLRHTFCSHLAMRGAPAMAIKELAGHADLATTMRYMHLSPAAKESAIRLLEQGAGGEQKPQTAK